MRKFNSLVAALVILLVSITVTEILNNYKDRTESEELEAQEQKVGR